MVKNLPAMRETWVRSLGQEDPLGKEMATHSSILAWRIPWTQEPGWLYSPWDHEEQDTTQRQRVTYLVCVQSPAIKHHIGFVETFGALYNTDFVVAAFWSLFHLLASCCTGLLTQPSSKNVNFTIIITWPGKYGYQKTLRSENGNLGTVFFAV